MNSAWTPAVIIFTFLFVCLACSKFTIFGPDDDGRDHGRDWTPDPPTPGKNAQLYSVIGTYTVRWCHWDRQTWTILRDSVLAEGTLTISTEEYNPLQYYQISGQLTLHGETFNMSGTHHSECYDVQGCVEYIRMGGSFPQTGEFMDGTTDFVVRCPAIVDTLEDNVGEWLVRLDSTWVGMGNAPYRLPADVEELQINYSDLACELRPQ